MHDNTIESSGVLSMSLSSILVKLVNGNILCDISFRLSCLAINDCSLKLTLWISMLGMSFDARNVPILMFEMNFSAYNLEFQCLQSTLISS